MKRSKNEYELKLKACSQKYDNKQSLSTSKMGKNKSAFTLAEIIIILTLLGVIAAITVPNILHTQKQTAARTKLKKTISDYEKVVENMRITSGYKTVSEMKSDMTEDDCTKARSYFKTKKVDSSNGCLFQTNDSIWWNVTDITKPIIALENGDDNKYIADGTYAAKLSGDEEGLKAFYLTTTQGTANQGHAFIVNAPSGAAKKALIFAKIIIDPYAAFSQTCTCSAEI